ncbi:MAG TPA: 2-hydroxychromene-2-carboxylate isomerase [Aliidongia sp.]|uniref:2-hydroxychromene-2-carboxylate isomerase n=1 Tax=Aliidongia sp. TaxID=1914230 RepID=UPI002DDD8C68|nr:2-hydroxychromene-2-carboxylate isomerase [Aliidongia sp.]HEV2678023.1 2-hydroxychromene-2-carboxylate isomerase [Aliidongia sp.]
MAHAIDFYFDFSSPYGYIATARIDEIGRKHGVPVRWRPFLLGAVFKITGAGPLPTLPLKGGYFMHDAPRSARLLGLPFVLPAQFPFGTVTACRAFYFVAQSDPEGAVRLARALYDHAFGKGRDICPVEAVVGIAAELGFDPDWVQAGIQAHETKELVKAEVDAAIAREVFGSPFFFVDDEPFWGHDRLDQLELWLEKGGW